MLCTFSNNIIFFITSHTDNGSVSSRQRCGGGGGGVRVLLSFSPWPDQHTFPQLSAFCVYSVHYVLESLIQKRGCPSRHTYFIPSPHPQPSVGMALVVVGKDAVCCITNQPHHQHNPVRYCWWWGLISFLLIFSLISAGEDELSDFWVEGGVGNGNLISFTFRWAFLFSRLD